MAEILQFPSLPADKGERERALNVRASWIVEAPAGSGKTGLLIQRYLKLLGDEGVREPEEVLAITFTRKATAELRERVVGEMEAAAAGAPVKDDFERETRGLAEAALARDGARGWGLLQRTRRLNIRTIDSVCAEIARALPVVSGSGGRLAPVTDGTRLFQEAARRTLMQMGGANASLDASLRLMLVHRDGNLGECERLIGDMLALREQWGRLVPLGGAELEEAYLDGIVLPRLEKALDLAICQALTQLGRSMPEDVLRELTEAAAEFAYLDGHQSKVSPIALCANRTEPPEARAEHLAHWRALIHLVMTPSSGTWRKGLNVNHILFTTDKTQRARLSSMIGRLQHRDDLLEAMCRLNKLPPARYPQEQWVVAKALFRVLSHALVELQMVFAERGECDFAEMGLAARAALAGGRGTEDLAAAMGTRTKHLLVDEMQDTSSSQYELIEQLTEGWDGRSQTVFLVGDPKQSIYRFRQARVERFVRTMKEERLGGLRLGCLRLTANFRSQAGLVERFNAEFSALFPAEVDMAHPEEVPFRAAVAVRGKGEAAGVVWHTAVVDKAADLELGGKARRRQVRADARAVRRIAKDWLGRARPTGREEPWRVAVLVRNRQHLGEIVEELKRDDGEGTVPFRATEIDALGERQEVLDLFGLARALLHPADRVAWFAVLHAPWCGLGLADLHLLAGADDPNFRERCVLDLVVERGHLLSEEGEARVGRVWPVLEGAMKMRGQTVAQRVERTWRSLGGDASLDAAEKGNALRFFELLDELEAESGVVDLGRLKTGLTKLYAESAVGDEAVELITIHKAKGLEWDAVMVPGLGRKAPSNGGRLLDWMEVDSGDDTVAQVVLAPIVGKGEDSSDLHRWIRSVDATRECAERKRLLYVAATRAREELHLFATADRTSKGVIAAEASSLLMTAWPVAARFFEDVRPVAVEEEDFGGGLALAAAGDEGTVDDAVGHAPVLRRLPLAYDPMARFRGIPPIGGESGGDEEPVAAFNRPDGSLAARAFGNAVHAFLQVAADRIAGGTSASALMEDVAGWRGRAEAVLRGDGLAAGMVERNGRRVVEALLTTLGDPTGRWILEAHPGARNEAALTGWVDGQGRLSVRLDRVFLAGSEPGEDGDGFCWIIDYKTASHGAEGMREFLAVERDKYRGQMETYARSIGLMRALSPAAMRVGLYYPVLGRLVWWVPEGVASGPVAGYDGEPAGSSR